MNNRFNSFIFGKYGIKASKIKTIQFLKSWADTGYFLYIVNNVSTRI